MTARINRALLTYTTAPPNLDWQYTREIHGNIGEFCGLNVRLVIHDDTEKADYQRNRYKNNLYGAMTLEIWDQEKKNGFAEEHVELREALYGVGL